MSSLIDSPFLRKHCNLGKNSVIPFKKRPGSSFLLVRNVFLKGTTLSLDALAIMRASEVNPES